MPTFAKTKTFALNESPIASTDLNSIGGDLQTFLNTTKLDADNIQAGAITSTLLSATAVTNANVSATAAIAVSKLGAGTANQVLINNATPTPAWTPVSGDLTNSLGVFTIAAGAVTEAKIAAGTITTASLSATAGITSGQLAGSIAFTKLAALTSTHILVGNGSNVATDVALSGDATLANTGALTIGDKKITSRMIDGSGTAPGSIIQGIVNTSPYTLTGSIADVTGTSVTFTTSTAQNILIFFGGSLVTNGAVVADVRVNVDGSDQTPKIFQANAGNVANNNGLTTEALKPVFVALSAGSHTIKMRALASTNGQASLTPEWYGIVLSQ